MPPEKVLAPDKVKEPVPDFITLPVPLSTLGKFKSVDPVNVKVPILVIVLPTTPKLSASYSTDAFAGITTAATLLLSGMALLVQLATVDHVSPSPSPVQVTELS